jgi:hypothetical protein
MSLISGTGISHHHVLTNSRVSKIFQSSRKNIALDPDEEKTIKTHVRIRPHHLRNV